MATYTRAIERAGGHPVLIPVHTPPAALPDLRARLDGLLMTGGGDVDPSLFDGREHPRISELDRQRDDLELAMARLAAQTGWPLLAICRGIQVLNVALGGSLYTHIADQFASAQRHDFDSKTQRETLAHRVRLLPGSLLANALGSLEVEVNSLHHQGVERLADGLTATAWAPDGLVEGVEVMGHPYAVGVQWHPECLVDSQPMQSLFRSFVLACEKAQQGG